MLTVTPSFSPDFDVDTDAWADALVARQAASPGLAAGSASANPSRLRRRIDRSLQALRQGAVDAAEISVLEALAAALDVELSRQMPLLGLRCADGRIRQSVRGRWVDVADELGEGFADLHQRGHAPSAWQWANRWLQGSLDLDAFALLPLFSCAHVLARRRAGEPHAAVVDRLALARRILDRRDLRVVVLTGAAGSSTSTVARNLAGHLGAVWVTADIAQAAHACPVGAGAVDLARWIGVARRLLAARHSVVLDCPMLGRIERRAVLEVADDAGALGHLVECHAAVAASMEPPQVFEPLDDVERSRATLFATDVAASTLDRRCRSLARWIDETADLAPVERPGWRPELE
jgi:hypothetical protein